MSAPPPAKSYVWTEEDMRAILGARARHRPTGIQGIVDVVYPREEGRIVVGFRSGRNPDGRFIGNVGGVSGDDLELLG